MKYLTSTYLKDIEEYKISIFMEEKCCITVKKILKIKEPILHSGDICFLKSVIPYAIYILLTSESKLLIN